MSYTRWKNGKTGRVHLATTFPSPNYPYVQLACYYPPYGLAWLHDYYPTDKPVTCKNCLPREKP